MRCGSSGPDNVYAIGTDRDDLGDLDDDTGVVLLLWRNFCSAVLAWPYRFHWIPCLAFRFSRAGVLH